MNPDFVNQLRVPMANLIAKWETEVEELQKLIKQGESKMIRENRTAKLRSTEMMLKDLREAVQVQDVMLRSINMDKEVLEGSEKDLGQTKVIETEAEACF